MTTALPAGWTAQYLGDCADILDNLRMPLSSTQRSVRRGPFPYCGANGVLDYIDDFMIDDDVVLLAEDGGNFDQWRTRPIAYRMKGKIWVNNHAHVLKAREPGCTGFLFYALQHKDITSLISSGTRSKLTRAELVRIKFAIPGSIGEQRLISDALTTVDDLIASLERLIGKKQAIKHGMMQQLLTGKTRLPGFDGEWAQTSMGESGLFSGAGVDKTSNTGEPPVRLLNYVDVYREEFVYPDTPRQMVTASAVKQRQCDIQAGDVFFTPTSETPDDIGRSAVSLQDAPGAVYSYHLVRWRPRDYWDPIFLGFAFNAEFFRSQVVALASGSGARYVISMPGFRSLKISQPPVEEQAAIGRVLRDSSIQIEILTNRLTKVRSIKQGMMQELLTGRTRLLPAGDSV